MKNQGLSLEAREKYWKELSGEEKVERMRQEVKNLQNSQVASNRTIRKLENHSHSNDALRRLLVPFESSYGEGRVTGRSIKDEDEVYF